MAYRIILLNGPSSSGKSTLAKQLQTSLKNGRGEEYAVVSIDDFLKMSKQKNIYEEDVYEIEPLLCEKVINSLEEHHGVIIDHVITSERIYTHLVKTLSPYGILSVLVTCPLQELKKREYDRNNRCIGTAEASYEYLFPKDGYGVMVNTYEMPMETCAGKIVERL